MKQKLKKRIVKTLSRQRLWQLQHEKKGFCQNGDGQPLYLGGKCRFHYDQWLQRRRKRDGVQPWEPGKPGRPPYAVSGEY